MDIGAVLSAAPSFGVGGILFGLVIYLLRASSTERNEYRTALAEEEKRNAEALTAEREISSKLREELDKERGKRFEAEELHSREHVRAEGLTARLAVLEQINGKG